MNYSLNSSEIVFNTAYLVGQVFGYFVIPSTALTSSIIYLLYIILLLKSGLVRKYAKYNLLMYKVVNVFFINILFIGFQNSGCQFCPDRILNTYWSQLYNLIMSRNLFILLAMIENVYSVLFNFERFCVLRNVVNGLFKIHVKFIYLLCLVVFAIVRIPDYLALVIIKYSAADNLYLLSKTTFAKTIWYTWYQVVVNFVYFLICIILVCVLNVLNIIQYRKAMRKKLKFSQNSKKIKRSEASFTRMIIISTFVTNASIFNLLISFIIYQVYYSLKVYYSPFSNLYFNISYQLILVAYIVDIFLYINLDKNLRKFIRGYFVDQNSIKSIKPREFLQKN